MKELENCELCEHRCRVNRLKGETGVCRMTTPLVASAQLHPAPPGSYTVFLAGCNYKCLNCQNWSISQYPDDSMPIRGYVEPGELAVECITHLYSSFARLMGAAIDASLPVCFLAFRPNFVLEGHPGADKALMERCVDIAEASGLQSVHWAGHTGIPGKSIAGLKEVKDYYSCKGATIAGSYAYQAGCQTLPRNCSTCSSNRQCPVKRCIPQRST